MGVTRSQQRDGVNITVCDRWDDFHEAVGLDAAQRRSPIWRGQASHEWSLTSVLEREALRGRFRPSGQSDRDYVSSRQSGLLDRFRRNVRALPAVTEDPVNTDSGWEALARQHGLDSRLLDWTRSPYVAAFFAFADLIQRPGWGLEDKQIAIWALSVTDVAGIAGDLEVLDDPLPGNARLHAQQGCFTLLVSSEHLDLASYLVSEGLGGTLERVEIPGVESGSALANLNQMGISYRALFPDFDGAANDANQGDRYAAMAAIRDDLAE